MARPKRISVQNVPETEPLNVVNLYLSLVPPGYREGSFNRKTIRSPSDSRIYTMAPDLCSSIGDAYEYVSNWRDLMMGRNIHYNCHVLEDLGKCPDKLSGFVEIKNDKTSQSSITINNKNECIIVGGQWNPQDVKDIVSKRIGNI
ncbi:MAG: hypothetical protein KJ697_01805 [Nanoarchaeota archaeon]|nr:hypothetical protein [Nanoarchaeota archaeon]